LNNVNSQVGQTTTLQNCSFVKQHRGALGTAALLGCGLIAIALVGTLFHCNTPKLLGSAALGWTVLIAGGYIGVKAMRDPSSEGSTKAQLQEIKRGLSKAMLTSQISKTEIQTAVHDFLEPYLTGQITKESEPQSRKGLMEILSEKYPALTEKELKEVELFALYFYVERSCIGCGLLGWSVEGGKGRALFMDALKTAIKKDFPGLGLNNSSLTSLVRGLLSIAITHYSQIKDSDAPPQLSAKDETARQYRKDQKIINLTRNNELWTKGC
jgi:hypothetical protein